MWPSTARLRPNRRYLLLLVVLLVALYVLVPQFSAFRSSWHFLQHPVIGWMAAAVGLAALTYLAAALTYCLLAFRPLNYLRTVLVQLAAMFINRLLPGGIGALGANYAYLRHARHNAAQAASVVTINNGLGLLGHGLIMAVVFIMFPGRLAMFSAGHSQAPDTFFKVLAWVAVGLLVLALLFGRRRLTRTAAAFGRQLLSYGQRPEHLALALLSSMTLTLCNVGCLACCGLALGVHLSFAIILLVFSFGIAAGTATPTPGGLGGFEAGLTVGFVAYNVDSSLALAIALLYRLVSYWLPLLAGAPALVISERKRLFSRAG